MAKLITDSGRKAIKKMVEISQCARALSLMPTAEDFALRLIGDLRIIARRVNSLSIRINGMLDKYSSIPGEFLLKGFDEILDKLENVNDYAKFTINETSGVITTTLESAKSITESAGSATSALTSATLQVGGGLAYGSTAIVEDIKLASKGNLRQRITEEVIADVTAGKIPVDQMSKVIELKIAVAVEDEYKNSVSIRDWTVSSTEKSTDSIDDFFGKGTSSLDDSIEWANGVKNDANELVDNTVGKLMDKVNNAKNDVEEKIKNVRDLVKELTKDFDNAFGFISGKDFLEDTFRNASASAYSMDTPVYDALGEVNDEIANFIENFSIAKVVTAMGGIVIGAGAATLAMDLLPTINVDRMLKEIIGGVDTYRIDKMSELMYNKYFESEPDLLEVPDVPWRLSKDDLEKYNADGYNKYLEEFEEENNNKRSELLNKMQSNNRKDRRDARKENRELMKEEENKSALKAMRKVRRDAIKAKQIEKYKGFLKIELDYLKRDCLDIKTEIKYEWDSMMAQYKSAIAEIKRFFTKDGYGGNDTVDRCCDRINDDATQIVEMCKSITIELTSTVAMVPTPYAIGTCVDMPVHKILAFFKDIKIIITFLKNLIRLGVDIISQLTILAKLICNGVQSLADILKTLKDLIGVDKILNMIDYLIGLFRPKMVEAKILIENGLSPVYYNETEDYENRVDAIENLLEGDLTKKVKVEIFKYSDDPQFKKKKQKEFGGLSKDEEEIEEWLEELEAKGDREIFAYRSPILNTEGDDFAGWIYYFPYAYDYMKNGWSSGKKRRRNKVIKKAAKKNKLIGGRLYGGVAQLSRNKSFGYYNEKGKYVGNSVNGFDAYYWYTHWTNDVTDCVPDFDNVVIEYDADGNPLAKTAINKNVVSPIQTTANGSMVELSDGRRVFVEGKIVKSGDFVNVDGVKYRVK